MKIRIYQINHEMDRNKYLFRNLEYIYGHSSGRFPEEIYRLVFEGETLADNLDDLYNCSNQMLQSNLLPRRLSVSDIFEIIHPNGKSSFYFVDSIGFILIPIDGLNM